MGALKQVLRRLNHERSQRWTLWKQYEGEEEAVRDAEARRLLVGVQLLEGEDVLANGLCKGHPGGAAHGVHDRSFDKAQAEAGE